ncbi:uncharacterized protein F4817DRAFT_353459 [Daldinia loculata]|uniref:uncharacterized protein n=1 Tax=Daldinia loculata TaxID=103429 RepID=UPI0020C3873C|nr:uncharacterized protein F4817DRAFT_353459 [Daldinia loculata]KAI1642213.1 hypothetical protein F4817DRAFT_353459 [Daldinia loculata]
MRHNCINNGVGKYCTSTTCIPIQIYLSPPVSFMITLPNLLNLPNLPIYLICAPFYWPALYLIR